MSLPAEYFSRLYALSDDPWGFRSRWYEQRKREITMSALTRPRYRRAFEPGCSIGVLTEALSRRCDHVLASDVDERATRITASALQERKNVLVEQRMIPGDWPTGPFDLIVVSEVGYYLSRVELGLLVRRIVGSLEPGGTLLACHWRHRVPDYPLSGDEVNLLMRKADRLVSVVHHEEEDFVLDLLTLGIVASPARREGLVG